MPGAGDGEVIENVEGRKGEEDGFEELEGREYGFRGCHFGVWRRWISNQRHQA